MYSLDQCKADPEKMGYPNADRGLCGFAGTLMALLDRKDYTFISDLMNCVDNGAKIKGVTKSVRIKNRLVKRITHGIIPNETHVADWKACIGFMILFKEWSKEQGNGHWQTCVDFSTKFVGWSYSRLTKFQVIRGKATATGRVHKLKDLPSTAVMSQNFVTSSLSYKKGDFGVPPAVIDQVLGLAGLTVAKTKTFAPNVSTLKSMRIWGVARFRSSVFISEMNASQNGGKAHKGVLLGVGVPGQARQDLAAEYNVVHWVYVPPVSNTKPGSNDFRIWSWGDELGFKDDMFKARNYVPVYAAYLS